MNVLDIPVLYINLDRREDRNAHMRTELTRVGFRQVERFPAIAKEDGALGCSFSHLKCVELAIQREYDCVLICEDDLAFLNVPAFLSSANTLLNHGDPWDVLLIAGNNMLPYQPVNPLCIRVHHCLTTTGYIVRKHYMPVLYANVKEGIQRLLKEPEERAKYAIDKHWLKLQRKDRWLLMVPPTVVQRAGYSDIEGRDTNFERFMLDYNKVVRPPPQINESILHSI